MEEENWFFKLSAFEDKLRKYYDAHPDFVTPHTKRNEAFSFIKGGLKDISITRTSIKWGIPVPWDDYEEKLVDNMVEVMSDILAEKLAKIVSPPWYVRLWKCFNTREQ